MVTKQTGSSQREEANTDRTRAVGGGQVAKIWLVHSKDQVLVQGRWALSKAFQQRPM